MQKGIYPYEYKYDWEKFNETSLPEKEELYSQLNMENNTDADYRHRKRTCKDFGIKKLGEYRDFNVRRDTLLLADVLSEYVS